MKNNYLMQAWLVLTLAVCFGGALAGVQIGLGPRIEANKLAKIMSQIPKLVPGAAEGRQQTVGGKTVYCAVDGKGATVGWVVPASGRGFADKIELLIGLDAQAKTITGMFVLFQNETPGLGNDIAGDWRRQLAGKSAMEAVMVTKGAPTGSNEIEAVTGATISSESVCNIVNAAVADFRQSLTERAE